VFGVGSRILRKLRMTCTSDRPRNLRDAVLSQLGRRSGVIGVDVGEDDLLHFFWAMSNQLDRLEDGGGGAWRARIHECQTVVSGWDTGPALTPAPARRCRICAMAAIGAGLVRSDQIQAATRRSETARLIGAMPLSSLKRATSSLSCWAVSANSCAWALISST
jgi:hypothetical protein